MTRFYLFLHYLLIFAYIAAPLVGVWMSSRGRKNGGSSARLAVLGTFAAGAAMGISLSVVYAVAVRGRVSIAQAVMASFFATALMLLLKGFDWLLRRAVWQVSVRRQTAREAQTAPPTVHRGAALAGNLVRVVVLFGFGLPFVMAAVVTYRPRVLLNDNPMSQLGFSFERVEFRATDGLRIAAWWMPAQRDRRALGSGKTVILCHGLGSNKSNQLVLCRKLIPAGFNVLAIDMRAHGESGGQLSGFGDIERRDVLGAVRWLQQTRSESAGEIYGLGASQGAAAVIAAAADASAEGQSIRAVAVYGTFDDLDGLVHSISRKTFLPPLNLMVDYFALPIASAHAGTDLNAFKPAALVVKLWPRPILVIHGVRDQIIDFSHGRRLYEAASQPKEYLWLERGDHNSIVNSDEAADAVVRFFLTAEPRSVI